MHRLLTVDHLMLDKMTSSAEMNDLSFIFQDIVLLQHNKVQCAVLRNAKVFPNFSLGVTGCLIIYGVHKLYQPCSRNVMIQLFKKF